MAKARVRRRVALGGHSVPERDIETRYARGLHNLIHLYIPLASSWFVYNSVSVSGIRRIASGGRNMVDVIEDHTTWNTIRQVADGNLEE